MLKKSMFAIISAVIIITCAFTPICFAETPETNSYPNDEVYETRNFDVSVSINEKNEYIVKEHIVVDFTSASHGIFRYIPITSTIMRNIDGRVENFKTRASITNVKVDGYKFKKDYENGNMVIQIGDVDKYLSGRQEYNISYIYRPHDDRMSAYDEVYFNILPGNCPTPIDSAKFTITMPKAFDKSKVNFYSGEYGSKTENVVSYTVDGNTINGQIKEAIPREFGATLRVELPNDYFTSQKTDNGLIMLMWIIIISCPLIAALLWLLFGRDEPYTKPVTVMPPRGMTPSDIGYIIDETVDSKDLISLLFYWADKGCITIADGDNKDFVLTKIKSLPDESKSYEYTMFGRLFREGEIVKTSDLSGKFFETMNTAKAQVKGQYDFKDSTRLYTKSSKKSQGVAVLLSMLPLVAATLISAYVNVANIGDFLLPVVLLVFTFACFVGVMQLVGKWNSNKGTTRLKNLIFVIVLIALAMFLFFVCALNFLCTDEWGKVSIYYLNTIPPMLCAIGGSLLSLFFATIMKKRTENMNIWYSEILGLKEFIQYAEKDRLEMLVNENPSYFFNIMPYAFVLGVSDTWAKNFESIAIEAPGWYNGAAYNTNGFNTFMFMSAMNHSVNAVQQNLSIPPAPTGGSGSGGFSGGGGGFSSGGGGGGGGMGSW